MAAAQRASDVCRKLFLLVLLQLGQCEIDTLTCFICKQKNKGKAVPSFAQTHCTGHKECPPQGPSWTGLWYVWLILLTVFLLLMCGIGASCVKFCCRKKRPPIQTFPPHAHDLTVIPMDHDSTAHSTVTSYSSLQYPQSFPLSLPFREADRNMASPPAYSLYAIEMPPSYDEAVRMAKPCVETPFVGQKLADASSEPAAPEEPNPSPTLPEATPEVVPEDSGVPEGSA